MAKKRKKRSAPKKSKFENVVVTIVDGTDEKLPHTQFKRLSKLQYIKFLSKYKDLDKAKRLEIAERAYKR